MPEINTDLLTAILNAFASDEDVKQQVIQYLKAQIDTKPTWREVYYQETSNDYNIHAEDVYTGAPFVRLRYCLITVFNDQMNIGIVIARPNNPRYDRLRGYDYWSRFEDTPFYKKEAVFGNYDEVIRQSQKLWESWLASFVELDEVIPVET